MGKSVTPDSANESQTIPEASSAEKVTAALRTLAASGPGDIALDMEIDRLHKLYKVGKKSLREAYKQILAEAEAPDANNGSMTPEEVAANDARIEAEAQARKKKQEADESAMAELERAAVQLEQCADLFGEWRRDFAKTGYVADSNFADTLLVSHVARLLPHSTGFMFYGASGSGKSDAVITAASFLPEGVSRSFTSVSDQALFYLGDIRGNYLLFGEMRPVKEEDDDYRQTALRQLISENKLTRGVVEKADGNTLGLAEKQTTGPCVMTGTTTTDPVRWNNEFVNRLSWCRTNDTTQMTQRVLDNQANAAASPWARADSTKLVKKWQVFHSRLVAAEVQIPFAHHIKVAPEHVTARRLFPLLQMYIKASALLHQHTRARLDAPDGKQYVVATLFDYDVAYKLVSENAPRPLEVCSAAALKMFDTLKPLLSYGNLASGQIQSVVKQPRENVRRWCNELVDAGLLELDGKSGKQNRFTLGILELDAGQALGLVTPDLARNRLQSSSDG